MANRVVFFITSWLLCEYASSLEVHRHMTLEELRSTFHVDHHDLVPEYEVVPIRHLRKRSIDPNPTNSFNHFSDHPQSKKSEQKPPPPYSKGGGAKNTPSAGQRPVSDGQKPVSDGQRPVSDGQRPVSDGQRPVSGGQKTVSDGQNAAAQAQTQLKLRAFGQPYNLTLTRNEGLLKKGKVKVWTVHPNATAQHGVEYIESPEEENEDIGELYQDEENLAAVLLRKEDGGLVVEGSIGSHLIIRPVPERLRKQMAKSSKPSEELSLKENEELASGEELATDEEYSKVHHHIVYKRNPTQEDTMSDYALMEPDHISKRYRRSLNTSGSSRKKREAPYTIYPEILVIVDYDGYRLHDGDNVQIKRYFVSFWNGVDLRYKLLKGPKIRISIAGIIISRGRDATPYLERNRVGRDAIDSAAALTDMGKYLFRERRLPVYDIAVAITKYDMCRRRKGGRCTKGTAGFAYVGGACVVNKRLEKVNSVAIIEDTGGFSGIIVAAHEVGHLLGAVHDGSPPPSYLGGPGAEKCQWTDGYIMSDLRHTERGFRWSPCSVSSFHHFLNGDTATCLYNAPHEDESLPRVLPGKLLTLDAQCRRDRGTSACFKDDRVCAQLFCFDSGSGYCVAYRPAAEGSPCGDGQYCLNGRCVAEHENIIPDYSQNQPSYIRSNANQGRPLFYDDEEEAAKQYQPQLPENYNYQTDPNYNQNDQTYNQYYNQNDQNYNQNPYDFYSTTPQTTKAFGWFTISTTRSPYDFQNFGKSYFSTTYSSRQTTKNPYDFADFGKTKSDQFSNNYLKRSYDSSSFYGESRRIDKRMSREADLKMAER